MIPLAYLLQTTGRADSYDRAALEAAAAQLNAQEVQLTGGSPWVLTCVPQPQDCGPVPS